MYPTTVALSPELTNVLNKLLHINQWNNHFIYSVCIKIRLFLVLLFLYFKLGRFISKKAPEFDCSYWWHTPGIQGQEFDHCVSD